MSGWFQVTIQQKTIANQPHFNLQKYGWYFGRTLYNDKLTIYVAKLWRVCNTTEIFRIRKFAKLSRSKSDVESQNHQAKTLLILNPRTWNSITGIAIAHTALENFIMSNKLVHSMDDGNKLKWILGPNGLNWQCCVAGSSKTAPMILIFSIAIGADYSLELNSIVHWVPQFSWIINQF